MGVGVVRGHSGVRVGCPDGVLGKPGRKDVRGSTISETGL